MPVGSTLISVAPVNSLKLTKDNGADADDCLMLIKSVLPIGYLDVILSIVKV